MILIMAAQADQYWWNLKQNSCYEKHYSSSFTFKKI